MTTDAATFSAQPPCEEPGTPTEADLVATFAHLELAIQDTLIKLGHDYGIGYDASVRSATDKDGNKIRMKDSDTPVWIPTYELTKRIIKRTLF